MRALLALLLISTCAAQEQAASLTARVVDPTNAPIHLATVQLQAPDGTTTTVQTDKKGRFEFLGLSPGTYRLQIGALGFLSETIPYLQIDAGEQRNFYVITLRIKPLPPCVEQICL